MKFVLEHADKAASNIVLFDEYTISTAKSKN